MRSRHRTTIARGWLPYNVRRIRRKPCRAPRCGESASQYLSRRRAVTSLAVLQEPDPRLPKVSRQIDRIDHETRRLAHDMLDTMYQHGGCGLAAPQVNARLRLIVVDTSTRGNSPLILINPIIRQRAARLVRSEEGCLSIPDLTVPMHRHPEIVVNALDLGGESVDLEASGWLCAVVQHEIDHLDGRLLTDALSSRERQRYVRGRQRRR